MSGKSLKEPQMACALRGVTGGLGQAAATLDKRRPTFEM
jgi:hypothetical protein